MARHYVNNTWWDPESPCRTCPWTPRTFLTLTCSGMFHQSHGSDKNVAGRCIPFSFSWPPLVQWLSDVGGLEMDCGGGAGEANRCSICTRLNGSWSYGDVLLFRWLLWWRGEGRSGYWLWLLRLCRVCRLLLRTASPFITQVALWRPLATRATDMKCDAVLLHPFRTEWLPLSVRHQGDPSRGPRIVK
jgi:hypothetical protein